MRLQGTEVRRLGVDGLIAPEVLRLVGLLRFPLVAHRHILIRLLLFQIRIHVRLRERHTLGAAAIAIELIQLQWAVALVLRATDHRWRAVVLPRDQRGVHVLEIQLVQRLGGAIAQLNLLLFDLWRAGQQQVILPGVAALLCALLRQQLYLLYALRPLWTTDGVLLLDGLLHTHLDVLSIRIVVSFLAWVACKQELCAFVSLGVALRAAPCE